MELGVAMWNLVDLIFQVLCDGSPRWVPTSGSQVPPGAFVGGKCENGETLYIGRAHHNGSLTPGKVSSLRFFDEPMRKYYGSPVGI